MEHPVTLTCFGFFTQAGKTSADYRQWLGDAMELVVESLVENRITGTFRGELPPAPANAEEPPVVIEEGIYSLVLTDIGV